MQLFLLVVNRKIFLILKTNNKNSKTFNKNAIFLMQFIKLFLNAYKIKRYCTKGNSLSDDTIILQNIQRTRRPEKI